MKNMYPCKKCLENSWNIISKKDEFEGRKIKWIEATCRVCGEQVEFGHIEISTNNYKENKPKKIKIEEEGQPCKKCGTPVIKKIPKRQDPRKKFWYKYNLYCPKCRVLYMLPNQIIKNEKL